MRKEIKEIEFEIEYPHSASDWIIDVVLVFAGICAVIGTIFVIYIVVMSIINCLL